MYRNVHIAGVGSYHPEKILTNSFFKNHFEKYDAAEHVMGLASKLGRERRTLAKEDETSISMGIEASKNALKVSGLSPLDIDGIISVSDTPEYLTPCCALMLKNALNASNVTNVFDMNNDCIGMITGIDVAARYLKTDKKYKRFLVVGSMLMSPFAREDDLVMYSCFSDGAAAVVLEVREEPTERGIIDSRMFTNSNYNKHIRFPVCGLSNVWKNHIDEYDKKIMWDPFDFGFLSDEWTNLISSLLKDNNYSSEDIAHYFMSQFSKFDLELTMEKLSVDLSKAIFIADKYGYTGCASPFMALDDKLKSHSFSKDDTIVFCSVAAGYSMAALLYKW